MKSKVKDKIVLDLEANGLLAAVDTMWVLSASPLDSDEILTTTWKGDGSYAESHIELIKLIKRYSMVLGHNIINYDIPTLRKLYKAFWKGQRWPKPRDTLVLSRLLYPDLKLPEQLIGIGKKIGPHSLEAWAYRLKGELKVEQEDWSEYDPNMVLRCESDVRLTKQLYFHELEEINK